MGAADGMKIDGDGNNQQVFFDVNDQDGQQTEACGFLIQEGNHLGTIKPDEVPANVAWGDDGSTLYMTARTGLYRIRLSTSGLVP